MKFSELIEPEGGYVNQSTSYFLVLGQNYVGYPSNPSVGFSVAGSGMLFDPNGNRVDQFVFVLMNVTGIDSTMTVWNGTTMESEPYTAYVEGVIVDRKDWMLIPPGYRYVDFQYAYGFWLTEEEVEDFILSRRDVNIIEKRNLIKNIKIENRFRNEKYNVTGPAIEENPANQSQEQNPNYIGKYLIGGPRW